MGDVGRGKAGTAYFFEQGIALKLVVHAQNTKPSHFGTPLSIHLMHGAGKITSGGHKLWLQCTFKGLKWHGEQWTSQYHSALRR